MEKNIKQVVFVIIGTMIGAGFASGQEIYLFFFSYGLKGIIGIFISCLFMGAVIYKTLKIANENELDNYKDFLGYIFVKFRTPINFVINTFILISFFIMIAGFGAYVNQEFGINSQIGSFILSFICFIVFMTNMKGIVKINEILVPILVFFLIIIGVISLKEVKIFELYNYVITKNTSNFIFQAILYSSYNSILLIPVLITLKQLINKKQEILKISIISAIVMFGLSIIIYFILVRVDVDITKLEMPAVYVVSHISLFLKYIYGFIILSSIFTTSISLGNSFLQNICKNKKSYPHFAIIMCITAIAICKFGFSNLVSFLYPIFGYLGLIQIYVIFNK